VIGLKAGPPRLPRWLQPCPGRDPLVYLPTAIIGPRVPIWQYHSLPRGRDPVWACHFNACCNKLNSLDAGATSTSLARALHVHMRTRRIIELIGPYLQQWQHVLIPLRCLLNRPIQSETVLVNTCIAVLRALPHHPVPLEGQSMACQAWLLASGIYRADFPRQVTTC
jgi:hypothetical protein